MGLVSFLTTRRSMSNAAADRRRHRGDTGCCAAGEGVRAAAWRAIEALESRLLFATYTVIDMGTLGGATSDGMGLNNTGQAAVTADLPADGSGSSSRRAAIRTGGALTDLGTFGGPDSFAAGINASGNVVGTALDSNNASRGFFYDGSAKTNLGTLGGSFSVGTAINDSNQVVGSSQETNSFGAEHAFVWQNGVMTDLGTLSDVGSDYSKAYAINGTGVIAGESNTITGELHAFRRTGTSLIDMGVLSGDSYSTARGINESGQIVGRSGRVANNVTTERIFFFNGTSMTNLGRLTGDNVAQGNDINGGGLVVGYSANNADLVDRRAVIHDGTLQDLNTLIDAGSGWFLSEALSINDSGQIVGTGTLNGNKRAFLLTPVGSNGGDTTAPTAAITTPAPTNGAATVTVTITYTDETSMNAASIGASDIQISRSGGGNLSVSDVTLNPVSNAAQIVASYTVAAPGGTWDAADDGNYTVTLLSSSVTDTSGNPAPTASTPFTVNFSANTGPTAVIAVPATVVTPGGASGTITVTYTDPNGVSLATVDTGDITVSGGGVASLPITAATADLATDGPSITVTYTFTPPGGVFDANDNGTFTVSLVPGQVLDTDGNAASGTPVQFEVDIPLNLPAIDAGFNGGSSVNAGFVAEATVIDLAGKVYVAGHSGDLASGTSAGVIRRFNPDGSVDSTFGSNGQVSTPAGDNDAYFNIALDASGKYVLVSGARGGDFLVARYNAKGKLHKAFGTKGSAVVDQGGPSEVAFGLATAPDGSVYAAGGAADALAFLKFDKRGRADGSFGAGGVTLIPAAGDSVVSRLVLQANGLLVAVGDSGDAVVALRMGPDGALDPAFNGGALLTLAQLAVNPALGAVDRTIGLAVQSDGKVLVANRTSGGTFGVVRLTTAGAPDAAFSGDGLATVDFGGNDDADAVLVQGSGQIVVVGTTDAGGSPQTAVAALSASGELLDGFDADGKFTVGSAISDPATSLVVGGQSIVAAAALQPDGGLVTLTSSGSPTSGSAVRRFNVPGSGTVGQFGDIDGKRTRLSFVDADGTLVTLTLKGGVGTAIYDGTSIDLNLTGAADDSSLAVKTKGGDGRARIGDLHTDGPFGKINARTSDLNGTLYVNGGLNKSDLGTLSGVLAAAGNINNAVFRGDMAGATLIAGTHLGADGQISGDDTYAAATLNKLTVAGAVAASAIGAGFNPVNGFYLDGGVVIGGPDSAINKIVVKNVVDGASRFFAGAFGKIKAPGKVDPTSDARFELL